MLEGGLGGRAGQGLTRGRSNMYVQRGWSNNNKKTYSQISNQVNILVDACYNIVKSKNLSIKICQEMNKSVLSFSISIDVNKKRKKPSNSIVPANTDTQMVDDIASDSDSTSTNARAL